MHDEQDDSRADFWRGYDGDAGPQDGDNDDSTEGREAMLVTATATATDFDTTVWSTAYVTIHVPTVLKSQVPSSSADSNNTRPDPSSTLELVASATTWRPANPNATEFPTTSRGAPSAPNSSSTGSLESSTSTSVQTEQTAVTTMNMMENSTPDARKRAVIGGLSGTIAALVAIGLLICLLLRRRRKRQEAKHGNDEDSTSEKGLRPDLMRKWTGLVTVIPVGRGSPRDTHIQTPSITQIAVDEDHRMIRMSTTHWPRPYALGEGEGCRECAPSGQLRVVNPDISRPTTPRSTDTTGSYYRNQRSAFAGFVFNLPKPDRHSRAEQSSRARETSTITIVDPSLSRECILTSTTAPSSRSYPSLVSLPTLRHLRPEETSLRPPQESSDTQIISPQTTCTRRPSLAPLQNAAGSASKTLSSIGHTLLQPFRAKSINTPTPPPPQKQAHLSASTYTSRMSGRSDPFDLDRPSIRGSLTTVVEAEQTDQSRFSLSEGT